MPRLLIRAPDHLGDGVMALPAIAALAALHPRQTAVVAPRWGRELYAHLPVSLEEPAEVPEVVVLLKPSWRAAWQHRRAPRRVGLSVQGRWPLLTEAVVPSGRHRVEDMARVARAAGAELSEASILPSFPASVGEPKPEVVLLLPGTASPETAQWRGFVALAERLGERAVFAGGPGEEALLARLAGDRWRVLPALPIQGFADLAAEVGAVVGNDSGLTHLAAAARRGAGRPVSAVHVVCGSTDPARTAAPGATTWTGLKPPCWPCYRKSCPWDAPCLHAEPGPIAERLRP